MHTQHILILVGADYEDLELWYPKLRLIEAGIGVTVAGPEREATYAGKHGYPCPCDAAISEMEADDFQGVVIPGGWMPDKLRRSPLGPQPITSSIHAQHETPSNHRDDVVRCDSDPEIAY